MATVKRGSGKMAARSASLALSLVAAAAALRASERTLPSVLCVSLWCRGVCAVLLVVLAVPNIKLKNIML